MPEIDTVTEDKSSQPDQDWEARFLGLQKTMNKKETEWGAVRSKSEKTIASMTQELRDAQERLKALEEGTSKWEQEKSTLTADLEKFRTESANSAKKLSRWEVLSKNPALLEHEQQGLLRTDLEGNDFEQYTAKYIEMIGQTSKKVADSKSIGATAGGGASKPGPAGLSELKSQLNDAMSKGDMATYDGLYEQILNFRGQ